jgi:pyruvate,orthophosphate dikinase
MDTILNLGINDKVELCLRSVTAGAPGAADIRRRFAEQFTSVVGVDPPVDPWQQLFAAIGAVFASWNSDRAVTYRRHHGISDSGGTAVTVQAMVFGNLDDRSGTGVLFSRNPLTGENEPYGEWVVRGQGEDVVSGRTTPLKLAAMRDLFPDLHRQLLDAAALLELDGRDVQDIEFTVESGTLWLLQSRSAKRSPEAAVEFAVALHSEGLVTKAEALALVPESHLEALRRPHVDPAAKLGATLLGLGEAACPGVAIGLVVTDLDEAVELSDQGVDVVLARPHTDPQDLTGMIAARGIITAVGGSTSHAAVVSRELGTPCVVGFTDVSLADLVGRVVTIDGTTGEIYDGALAVAEPQHTHARIETLRAWQAEIEESSSRA